MPASEAIAGDHLWNLLFVVGGKVVFFCCGFLFIVWLGWLTQARHKNPPPPNEYHFVYPNRGFFFWGFIGGVFFLAKRGLEPFLWGQ